MSLRNRIVVAALLMTLVAPVAGWAVGTDRDPDGQQIKLATVVVDDAAKTQTDIDGAMAAVRAERSAPQRGIAFVLDRFQDWLLGLVALSL